MTKHEHPTTEQVVAKYQSSSGVFVGVLSEMRELSKKKPDGTLNKRKVTIVNRVLDDLQDFLKDEADGKYLDLLDDEDLPQYSDAVLVMVQYENALSAFCSRYHGRIGGEVGWVTVERLQEWQKLMEQEDEIE